MRMWHTNRIEKRLRNEEFKMDYILTHHGILGQRKGRRRYQLPDGTWTEEGKRRRRKGSDRSDRIKDSAKKAGKKVKGASDNAHKKAKSVYKDFDDVSSKRLREYRNVTNEFSNLNTARQKVLQNQRKRDKNHVERLDLSKKSNKELQDEINREVLERRYNEVFNSPEVSRGRQLAEEALSVSGDVLAVTAAGLGAAVSVKKLLGK